MEPVNTATLYDPRPSRKVAAFLLFALIFLYVGRSHEALVLPIRFNLIFIAITLLYSASWLFSSPLRIFKQSVTLRRITYFALWATITIPLSRWPGGSVEAAIHFFKMYMFLLLGASLLMRFRLTSVALVAYVGGLLVTLLLSIVAESDGARVSTITSTYDSNEMAMIAVMVMPILFFSLKNAKLVYKALYLVGIAICVIAVALSGSRGGMLGMMMVGLYILFVSSISKFKKILIVAVAAVVFVVAVPSENLLRLTKTLDIQNDYNLTAKSGRLNLWIADIKKIVMNPVTGVGLGQSTTLEESEMAEGAWMEAHNSYIEVPLETGLPGFFFIFSVMLIGWRRLRELRLMLPRGDRRLALVHGMEGALWGFFVCITFLSVAFYALSLFYFVLIECVYNDITGKYLVSASPPGSPPATPTDSQPEPVVKRKRSYRMRKV